MLDKFIVGRYVPSDSIIHKLDPRTKLLLLMIFIGIVFIANNTLTYAFLTAYIFCLMLLTNISLPFILKGLKPVYFLVVFTLVLHLFMTKGGSVIFTIGSFEFYENGLKQGLLISLRFLLLVLMTTMVTLTTTPIQMTDGLESLLKPFSKLGLPVHELALMLSIALRFIPTLLEETDKIIKAQTARGVEFSTGSLAQRLKSLIPVLIPLFVNSFKRAEELAIAMESRGYKGGEGRTKYRKLVWKFKDTAMLIFIGLITALLIIYRT